MALQDEGFGFACSLLQETEQWWLWVTPLEVKPSLAGAEGSLGKKASKCRQINLLQGQTVTGQGKWFKTKGGSDEMSGGSFLLRGLWCRNVLPKGAGDAPSVPGSA